MRTSRRKFKNRISIFRFLLHAISLFIITGGIQTGFSQMPVVTVQLTNPAYDCTTEQYCVDVEFLANEPDISVYLMNIRFFYDDNVLEFAAFTDFQGGYAPMIPNPPLINTSNSAGLAMFNFAGPAEYVNGAMHLANPSESTILLDSIEGTMLFKICFTVDDENADPQSFCPSIVLDLEVNPSNGGYLGGSDGIVITVENTGPVDSRPSTENVVQYNWMYTGSGAAPFGEPVEDACIAFGSLACDIILPLSILCRPNTTVISSIATGGCGSLSYAWTVQGGGASIRSGQGTPQISVVVGHGPATIVLMVTDEAGSLCASTNIIRCASRREAVYNTEAVEAEAIWDHGFSSMQDDSIVIRTDDVLQQFKLWPNPANEAIHLRWASAFEYIIHIRLTNSIGQIVFSDKIAVGIGKNDHMISVREFPVGSYVLDILTDFERQTQFVVIVR